MVQPERRWPPQAGELAELIRTRDWAATPLGPTDTWPERLKHAVEWVLAMRRPASVLWGPHLRLIYNDALAALLGPKHPGTLGRPLREAWPEVAANFGAAIEERGSPGRTPRGEQASVGPTGAIRSPVRPGEEWIPLLDDEGSVLGYVVSGIGMTEAPCAPAPGQHPSGKAACESEERFRALVEGFAQAVWEADAQGMIVGDSPSWRTYTGQSVGECLGWGWLDAIHPDDRAFARRQWSEAVATRRKIDAEFRIRHAGGWRWTNLRAAPLYGDDGRVHKWVGMNVDITARKKFEEALRRQDEDLRLITNAVPVQIGYIDREERYRFVNAEFARFFGVEPHRLIGRTLRDAVGDAAYGRLRPYVVRALAGETVRFENRATDINGPGHDGWTEENYIPRFAADGKIEGFFLLNIDITARKRADAALRESEERLKLALAVGGLATWDWNVQTGSLTWSPNHFAVSGYEPGEIEPSFEAWLARVHPDDRAETVATIEQARDQHTQYSHEFRNLLPSGEIRWCSSKGTFFYNSAGAAVRMIGVMEDITDRVKAVEALRESEERFRQFGEASPNILWIRDADTLQLEYLSPAFERVFGASREEALRREGLENWVELIVPEDRKLAVRSIERVRQGERVSFEYRVRRPENGEIRWISRTDFPLVDETGVIRRIGAIGQDITESKLAQRALEASERHAKLLLAELQHRVRNTLSVVRSIARRTAVASETPDDYAMHLDGRLNAFARVQAGLTRNPSAGLDLATIIADELAAVSAHEGDRVRTLKGPRVRVRPKAAATLALAFHELATNAVKYGALSTERGRIKITWEVEFRDETRFLRLDWIETGVALCAEGPRRRGFGMDLLERTLGYELGGEAQLDFAETGLLCTMVLPINDELSLEDAEGQS